MHQQYFSPKTYIFHCKKNNSARLCILGKITAKYMFVCHNKCCSGISPKSCSNPSLHSWERSCSDVLPGAQRGGHAGLVSPGTLYCGVSWRSVLVIGDQSLARCRISIAEGLPSFPLLTVQLVPQPPLLVHVGVSASSSLMREKSEKFSPPWSDKSVPGRLSAGTLSSCRLRLNCAI